MPAVRHFSRIDTLELKVQIKKKLGSQKAEKYFNLLTRYLNLKIRKSDFDKLCISLIGRDNIRLHNELIIAIVKNATCSTIPPQKHVKFDDPLTLKVNGTHPITDLQSLCAFPQSPRKNRTPNLRERKFKDRTVPISQHFITTKVHHHQQQEEQEQNAFELVSLGSKPPLEVNSVEDGEEVEQNAISTGVYGLSPVSAPLGINIHSKGKQKPHINGLVSAYHTNTCHYSGHLPATNSLKNMLLNHTLQMEGLDISMDFVNLLNNGLDSFLKSVLKPSLELARSRSSKRSGPGPVFLTSMLDFRMATEVNPKILGDFSHILHDN